MSTFDGSTGGAPPVFHDGHQPAAPFHDGHQDEPGTTNLDSLELLRERLREKQAEEFENHLISVPGGFRLSCRTVIEYEELKKWRLRALPKTVRGKKMSEEQRADFLNIRQFFTALLAETTEFIEVLGRDGRSWSTVTGEEGQALTPADSALKNAFGVLDVVSLFRKLFPRDSELIHAGNGLLVAAGYADEVVALQDGELPDPPETVR